MTFTKTYQDKCVTYYESENGRLKIIENSEGYTLKGNFNLFNIMGTTYGVFKTLDKAIKYAERL